MTISEGSALAGVVTGVLIPCIGWWWNSRELRRLREREAAPVPVLWRADRIDLLTRVHDMPFEVSIDGVAAKNIFLISLILRNVGSKELEGPLSFRLTVGEKENGPVEVLGHTMGRGEMTLLEEKITVTQIESAGSNIAKFDITVPYLNRHDRSPRFNFWTSNIGKVRLECGAPGVKLVTPESEYLPYIENSRRYYISAL